MYVPPLHRNQGHFKRLYAAVRELAAEERVAGLRLYAEKANARAHAVVRVRSPGDCVCVPCVVLVACCFLMVALKGFGVALCGALAAAPR